ncbi:Bidirectional sugar transporter SWEET [Quillaja saponaria]|uniref:Bidirectional sugar transporter SWEET n=1 Tax=Quillaja saponaria TaxID=32244 RepID=A0AAD7Q1V0_QUISA|nr:Bidirectional sugar transporter SWEET [Quillaja saponaria]
MEKNCCLSSLSKISKSNMTTLSSFVGILGNIISMLLFLSPLETFWRIVKHKSTEEFQSLPYICTLLNSALWTYYGVIKPETLVSTINGFGVVVETVYVIIFLIFAAPKMRAKTAILVVLLDVGFLAGAILVTLMVVQGGDLQVEVIGFICASLNIIMYGSPLAAMKTVVMTKSVEYMPFLLSFSIFLNGGIWTVYAVLVKDIFLGVPNGAGFVLGIAQLVLYAIYRKPKSYNIDFNDLEDQHLLQSSNPQ